MESVTGILLMKLNSNDLIMPICQTLQVEIQSKTDRITQLQTELQAAKVSKQLAKCHNMLSQ